MTELHDVIKYLGENLTIDIEQTTTVGTTEEICVKLLIGDSVISESSCVIPIKYYTHGRNQ